MVLNFKHGGNKDRVHANMRNNILVNGRQ